MRNFHDVILLIALMDVNFLLGTEQALMLHSISTTKTLTSLTVLVVYTCSAL